MLRAVFGEEHRMDEGILLDINRGIDAFCSRLRSLHPCSGQVNLKWIRLDLWATGLGSALNELEQSVYCCNKYKTNIRHAYEEEMNEQERDDYYRFMYYYKNAFVRIFSTLDKTGYFLDTLFDVGAGRVKERFSYFTVLRQIHHSNRHKELEQRLFDLKVKYQDPLNRLRKKRNLEIHSMNVELIDDVWRKRACFADRRMVEPLDELMEDLEKCFIMVCQSLHEIFKYSVQTLK